MCEDELFPRMWIDNTTERMKHFVECMVQYHKEFDEERKIFRSKPEHDWSSHMAYAVRTLAGGFEDEIIDNRPLYTDLSAGRLAA